MQPTKKVPYPLPFTNEVLNTITGYEAFFFQMDIHDIIKYIQLQRTDIRLHLLWTGGIWKVMSFKVLNEPPTYQKIVTKTFKEYLDNFMKIFMDDYIVYSKMESHLQKFKLYLQKCKEYGINLNPKKCAFMVFSGMILGFIISKEGKLLDPKKIQGIVNMPPL